MAKGTTLSSRTLIGRPTRSALVAATLALLTVGALPARAGGGQVGADCNWSAGTLTVTLHANNDMAMFVRSGSAIYANGTPCSTATVTNTDTIIVSQANPADAHDNIVGISNAGGRFQPGATSESAGTPEIEWQINMGNGFNEFRFFGGPNADTVTLGNGGGVGAINLNANETSPDADLVFDAIPSAGIQLRGNGGNDLLRAQGGAGTGAAYPAPVSLFGGASNDELWGSNSDDYLESGTGFDTLHGFPGNDWLKGGGGNDILSGHGGDDTLDGHDGADQSWGGNGMDLLRAGSGQDHQYGGNGVDTLKAVDGVHDVVNGGPPTGADTCITDQIDSVSNC